MVGSNVGRSSSLEACVVEKPRLLATTHADNVVLWRRRARLDPVD